MKLLGVTDRGMVCTLTNFVSNQLTSAIEAAEGLTEPFCHFHMPKIFSSESYEALRANLPDRSLYEPLLHIDARISDRESTRLRFNLTEKDILRLPADRRDFWQGVYLQCCAPGLKETLFRKMAKDLEERFKMPLSKIPAKPWLFLYKDLNGYKIRPHVDTHAKAVTLQIYLPKDAAYEKTGTIIYEKTDQGHQILKQFPFLPNSGYAFAVSDKSWHGVAQIESEGIERDSLMVIYYVADPSSRM